MCKYTHSVKNYEETEFFSQMCSKKLVEHFKTKFILITQEFTELTLKVEKCVKNYPTLVNISPTVTYFHNVIGSATVNSTH